MVAAFFLRVGFLGLGGLTLGGLKRLEASGAAQGLSRGPCRSACQNSSAKTAYSPKCAVHETGSTCQRVDTKSKLDWAESTKMSAIQARARLHQSQGRRPLARLAPAAGAGCSIDFLMGRLYVEKRLRAIGRRQLPG